MSAQFLPSGPALATSMVPELMLLGFAAWTLLVLFVAVGYYRWNLIFRGQAGLGDFPSDQVEGADWYKRAMRAHANCIENLPVFAVLVYVAHALQVGGAWMDLLSALVLAARIPQSLVHICFVQSDRVVGVRFSLFSVQLVSFFVMLALILQRLP